MALLTAVVLAAWTRPVPICMPPLVTITTVVIVIIVIVVVAGWARFGPSSSLLCPPSPSAPPSPPPPGSPLLTLVVFYCGDKWLRVKGSYPVSKLMEMAEAATGVPQLLQRLYLNRRRIDTNEPSATLRDMGIVQQMQRLELRYHGDGLRGGAPIPGHGSSMEQQQLGFQQASWEQRERARLFFEQHEQRLLQQEQYELRRQQQRPQWRQQQQQQRHEQYELRQQQQQQQREQQLEQQREQEREQQLEQ